MARSDRDFNPEDQRQPSSTRLFPEPPTNDQEVLRGTNSRPGTGGSDQNGGGPSPRSQGLDRPATARRTYPHPARARAYSLRDSEVKALAEIGTFRVVTQSDLARHLYSGNASLVRRDLNNLARQGLIRRRTLHPERSAHIALTAEGHRFIEAIRPPDLSPAQRLYHGFVKPREAKHDAAIYRLYMHEKERITREGGRVQRVVLDFEFKKSINRRLSKLRNLPEAQQVQNRKQIAEEHGLSVVNGRIPLPDLRIEYETREQDQTKVDLELATADYHRDSLAAKAKAGFAMFALPEDAVRLRPAMQDPELMQEIFSL